MKFFLPDAQDLVDPSFDFDTERRSSKRERQRDDLYAHELFETRPFDGYLVSKGIVDGYGDLGSRYTVAQRHRLARESAHGFFRIGAARFGKLDIMGDCGAFTYVRELEPPYSVSEVHDFYEECGFDLGISVDHVILDFNAKWDRADGDGAPVELRHRRQLTLDLAADFLSEHRRRDSPMIPLGVAQGWSPASYADSVQRLQEIGYNYIAMGGMVPLKTAEILSALEGANSVRRPNTKLHLLGVTRTEAITARAREYGVASFDSTSPLRQAFKDDKDNFHTLTGTYTAIRIPQVDANPTLSRQVAAGQIRQELARDLEKKCLRAMADFERGVSSAAEVVSVLRDYERVYDPKSNHEDAYRRTLEAAPWRRCACDVCRTIGYHVILFRGAERNRRRGLHNVWTLYQRLTSIQRHQAAADQNGSQPNTVGSGG
jgi:hypothetical protein